MSLQYHLSACALGLLAATVLARASMLRRRGVRAIVFGKTEKSDFLLIPLALAIAYTVLSRALGLPMWKPLARPFWTSSIPGWFGLALCFLALVGFALSLASFGSSFRVGIDEQAAGKLVTTGMFGVSRNPLYACFLLFFLGLLLVHRNIVIVVVSVLFALLIHRQVLREERFLRAHYGAAYEAYCQQVRRYF